MERIEHPASLESAAEDQYQMLSESEIQDVSGGGGSAKPNIIMKVSGVPGAPPGLGTGRQHYFK